MRVRSSPHSSPFEQLESRQLLSVSILNPIADSGVPLNSAPTVIDLTGRYDAPNITGSVAKFDTVLGVINVELEDTRTPLTVANFKRYIDAARYNNLIFHRSIANFVIQSGGFYRPELDFDPPRDVPRFEPVMNEPGILNTRGTIAMAKSEGNPNSATSQWFFNLGDNADLNTQNGGFTVFGHVIQGLDVMDAIAAVPTYVFDSPFENLPLRTFNNGEGVDVADYIALSITTVDKITYTVTSSNAALVMPGLSGNNLTLNYAADTDGASTITVRITAADGTFAEDAFNVSVGARPTVASLQIAPGSTFGQGVPITLTAVGVNAALDPIAKVQFYRDANGNGTLEPDTDSLLGEDSSSDGGYTLAVSTGTFPVGATHFFARAVDTTGLTGNPATAAATITERPRPTIGSLNVTPTGDIRKGTAVTLTAANPAAGLQPISKVQFFRDTNGNGTLDAGTDQLLGEDTDATGGYTLAVDSNTLPVGQIRFFARAVESADVVGDPATALATFFTGVNVGTFTVAPTTSNRTQMLSLSAAGFDGGGLVSARRVEFYWDSDNSGTFDPARDKKVKETTRIVNGQAAVSVSGKSLRVGSNIFFVRVLDNQGTYGTVKSATATITNLAPTVRGIKTNTNSLGRVGLPLDLSLTTSFDPDGKIVRVQYFRDSGTTPDGSLNPDTDTLLGTVNGSGSGMRLRVDTAAFPAGQNRFFARVFDNDGTTSTPVSTVVYINAAPTIGSFVIAPTSGPRSSNYTLEANNVADTDGGIRSVEFFWDTNNDGVINSRDRSLGKAKLVQGVWTLQIRGSLLNVGANRIFARAEDNFKNLSALSGGTLTLLNS